MKTLELDKMLSYQGGDMQSCLEFAGSGAAAIVSASEIIVAASVAGPIGWASVALGLSVLVLVSSLSDGAPC